MASVSADYITGELKNDRHPLRIPEDEKRGQKGQVHSPVLGFISNSADGIMLWSILVPVDL